MEGNQLNKNQITLPENIASIVGELVEKYRLEDYLIDEETKKNIEEFAETPLEKSGIIFLFSKKLNEMLAGAKTSEERKKIIENLPCSQLVNTLKELEDGKITIENLPTLLQARLNVSKKITENLIKDLKQKIPSLVEVKKEEKKKEIEKVIKPPTPPKKDIYREPTE